MTLLPGRLLRLFAVTCGIVLLFAVPSAAQQERSIEIRRVAVDGHPNVTITVSVPEGVSTQDIEVTENGRPVEILNVRPFIESGQQIDVVLVIDTSKTMTGAPLAGAISAARSFVQHLSPKIAVGLLTYSDQTRVVQTVTTDHQRVLQAIDAIGSHTQYGTVLYDAVGAAAKMLSGPAQHNVVLLSDGKNVGPQQGITKVLKTPAQAVQAARSASAALFTVGFGSNPDVSLLQGLADQTGGSYAPATTSNIVALYQRLADLLSNQYIVLYRSTAPAGAQVTVGAESGGAVDSAIVLMPRLASPFGTEEEGRAILTGNVGLVAVIASSFAAVFLLVLLIVGTGTRAVRDRDLARRMAVHQTGEVQSDEAPSRRFAAWIPKPFVHAGDRVAEVGGFQSSLAQRLERAGLPMRPGELVAGSVLTALLVGLIGGLAFQSALLALGLAVLAFAGPYIWVTVKMNARIDALHAQLPDVLMILASSMRAGHSFLQALDTVSKEIGEPGGPEFARVVGEIRLGRPFDEAMTAMAERVGTEEFRWAIMALNVQREVGGNLAEILDTLAETVREREFVRRQIKVLSSEGRLSAKILTVLPFVIIGYITLVNPEYMKPLYTTSLGLVLIGAGVLLMTIGLYWVRRTTKIDV